MKKYSIDKLRQAWGAGVASANKSGLFSEKQINLAVNVLADVLLEIQGEIEDEIREVRHAFYGFLEEAGEKRPEKRARELAEDFRERIGLPRKLKNSSP